MRRVLLPLTILCVAVLGVGCASHRTAPVAEQATTAPVDIAPEPEARPAAALVFTPPTAYGDYPLDLARDQRRPAAFAGFEESTMEYFRILTIDRQYSGTGWGYGDGYGGSGWGTGMGDRYYRKAVTERVGAIRR